MSVEEAREAVLCDLIAYTQEYPHRIPDSECDADGSLSHEQVEKFATGCIDRLILEVQADMHCVMKLTNPKTCWDMQLERLEETPDAPIFVVSCASCAAKRTLWCMANPERMSPGYRKVEA